MSQILLLGVNSQYIHSMPALNCLTRAAETVGCGELVQTHQASTNLPADELLAEIIRRRPTILACSVYIFNSVYLAPLLRCVKQLLPHTLLLLGGPEAAARPDYYLRECNADAVCLGEGELPFADLLRAYKCGEKLHGLPGWQWRDQSSPAQPAPPADLAHAPFLYSDQEGETLAAARKIIYYESSRGCPFGCTFCASARESLRERPLSLVLPELTKLARWGGQIKFIDRTFNAAPERACAIIEHLLSLSRPGLSWHMELSPFLLDSRLIDLLCRGARDYFRLELGVQSLDPAVLQAVGRRGKWDAAEPSVRRLIASPCHVHLDLIAGLPQDTPQTFAASFHRLHQLNPDYLQLGFLKLLPGSPLAETAGSCGLLCADSPPYRVLQTPDMSAEYLLDLMQTERAFNALYNKAGLREQLIAKAETFPGGALAMYERAAVLLPRSGADHRAKLAVVEQL